MWVQLDKLIVETEGRQVALAVDPKILRSIVRSLVSHTTGAFRAVGLELRRGLGGTR